MKSIKNGNRIISEAGEKKCGYDESPDACFNCPFSDCIRDDITDDVEIKERYGKRTNNKTGITVPEIIVVNGKKKQNILYQREYRRMMPKEQKERYRAWQRDYARRKREAERREAKVG